jgi:hypothetical protein
VITVALVAAKDAGGTIGATVAALRRLDGVAEVWVVDDGSTDDTASAASAAGAHVVRLEDNVGKGGALAAGLAATPHATRYLLADADLGETAVGLAALLNEADGTGAQLVVGVLPSAGRRGGFGLVKRLARAGIRRAASVDTQAPISGQRVVDAHLVRSLTLAPRFGVEVGMTIDVARRGGRVVEVPVVVDHEHRGRSVTGFAHRARQGRDIVGALVPRLTSEGQRIGAALLAGVLVTVALSGLSWLTQPPRGAALGQPNRVLLFGSRGLRLHDADRPDLPTLRHLASTGAVGALTVRTTDRRSLAQRRGPERPSPFDAYASLGASARVRAARGLGRIVDDRVDGMAATRTQARADHTAGLPGELGDALRRAGKRTAVVAGPDASQDADYAVASALADRYGRVGSLDVTSTPDQFVTAISDAWHDANVVAVDAGELTSDRLLRSVLAVTPPDALVIVFSPTPPGSEWELTPIVIRGAGAQRGSVESSSTRRPSLAALVDIAPTVLHAVGAPPDAAMTGTALRASRGSPHLDQLTRLEVDGAVRSRFFLPAAVGYTVAGIVFYLAFLAVLAFGGGTALRRWFRVGVCVAAAFPLAILAQGGVQHWLHAGGESPGVLVLLTAALGASAAGLRRLRPVFALAWITVAVIAVDVAVTGPIHAASILGYTIQTTGRFYGLPNASFAVFAPCLILVAAGLAGDAPPRPRATAAVATLGAGVVFLGAPWLGNDVGGMVTMAPIAAALAWRFYGRRFTTRAVVTGAAALAVVGAGVVVAEAALSGSSHLARTAREGAANHGSLANTLARRFDANMGLLVDQWWGFLCFALAAGAIYALASGKWPSGLRRGSPLRGGALAILVGSIVGFLVNDSGPVVTVLFLVVLAPPLALLALDGPTPRPASARS